jgi:hypothetical protein
VPEGAVLETLVMGKFREIFWKKKSAKINFLELLAVTFSQTVLDIFLYLFFCIWRIVFLVFKCELRVTMEQVPLKLAYGL